MPTKTPTLILGTGRIIAAKNIRRELKAAFPGIKFSVTSESYSMGDSIRVRWTDGPTGEAVESIVNKYQAGNFDGMTDSYTYSSSEFNKNHGEAKYVFANRDVSPAVINRILEKLRADGWAQFEGKTSWDYFNGSLHHLDRAANHVFNNALKGLNYTGSAPFEFECTAA